MLPRQLRIALNDTQTLLPEVIHSTYQNYLTDPRFWAIISSNQAIIHSTQNPSQITYRQLDPTPPRRYFNAIISKAYPKPEIIEAFLHCFEAFINDRPHLFKPSVK